MCVCVYGSQLRLVENEYIFSNVTYDFEMCLQISLPSFFQHTNVNLSILGNDCGARVTKCGRCDGHERESTCALSQNGLRAHIRKGL